MSDARRVLDNAINEKDFQQWIIDLARLKGFKVYHTFDSRRSEKGFPDLVMVPTRPGLPIVFAECKRQTGRVTVEQQEWIDAIEQAIGIAKDYVQVHVWRPEDMDSIIELLSGQESEESMTNPAQPTERDQQIARTARAQSELGKVLKERDTLVKRIAELEVENDRLRDNPAVRMTR